MATATVKISAQRGKAVFSLEEPVTSVRLDLSLLRGHKALTPQVSPVFGFSCDMGQLDFGASVRIEDNLASFTTFAKYGPTLARKIRLGFAQLFNVASVPGYFTEFNMMVGAFIEYSPFHWFTLSHDAFYLNKLSVIDIGSGDTLRLQDDSIEVNVSLIFFPIPPLKIKLSFATYDEHTFNLASSPIFSAALSYTFAKGKLLNGHLRKTERNAILCEVGFKAMCEYVDFFVLSGNKSREVYTLFTRFAL